MCFVSFCLLSTQLFNQFDADGEGFADVETFLEVCIKLLIFFIYLHHVVHVNGSFQPAAHRNHLYLCWDAKFNVLSSKFIQCKMYSR